MIIRVLIQVGAPEKEAIHAFFIKLQVAGFGPEKRKSQLGGPRQAIICGDLVLTLAVGPEQKFVPALRRAGVLPHRPL